MRTTVRNFQANFESTIYEVFCVWYFSFWCENSFKRTEDNSITGFLFTLLHLIFFMQNLNSEEKIHSISNRSPVNNVKIVNKSKLKQKQIKVKPELSPI